MYRLLSILTNGIADYLQKKWLSREFHDGPMTEANSIGVTIGHVLGLLVVLGLSIAVAIAIMLIELAVNGSKTSQKFGRIQNRWWRRSNEKPKFPRFYQ